MAMPLLLWVANLERKRAQKPTLTSFISTVLFWHMEMTFSPMVTISPGWISGTTYRRSTSR